MAYRSVSVVASVLLLGAAFSALASPAVDRRPTGPAQPPRPQPPQSQPKPQEPHRRRLPPYCPPPPIRAAVKPDNSFDIQLLSVDTGRNAAPAVSAFLAATSNRDDQRVGLRARANGGGPVLQVSEGPTLRVKQDATDIHDLSAPDVRVSAHPHLNAQCAEAVDFIVERASPGESRPVTNAYVSLVFENGDTKLLSDTARPDGARHLVYATVFFPSRPVPCPR